jgi:hypothetical protein
MIVRNLLKYHTYTTEDSETAVSILKSGDRAVEDTEYPCNIIVINKVRMSVDTSHTYTEIAHYSQSRLCPS